MADETQSGGDAVQQEREMEEHERQAREHAGEERSPDERRDEAKPAPPGQAQQPRG